MGKQWVYPDTNYPRYELWVGMSYPDDRVDKLRLLHICKFYILDSLSIL